MGLKTELARFKMLHWIDMYVYAKSEFGRWELARGDWRTFQNLDVAPKRPDREWAHVYYLFRYGLPLEVPRAAARPTVHSSAACPAIDVFVPALLAPPPLRSSGSKR